MNNPTLPHAPRDNDRPPVPEVIVPQGVQPFHLQNKPVRGRLIRLGLLADALLSRHDNPDVVKKLTGQALALTAALATALKFQGSFSLQVKGDGAVPMLLADCTDDGMLRGYARADMERLALLNGADAEAGALLGSGYLAFTVDQGPGMDRYQGIVALQGETLAEMTGHYFASSEQLASRVWLAAGKGPQGWRGTALVLERVAGQGGIGPDMDSLSQDDAWETAVTLAATVKDEELLDDALAPEQLLYRLFHAEGLVLDRPRPLSYGCRCSRARLASVLEGFGNEDLDEMAQSGEISMTCEFCNTTFRFARDEVRGASRPS
ncbi:Hsp33 family molecular chaperone HslO [Roseomonas marmotae]|uniref:Hsp33 family molecular chaperone HslO n=1 Tax=Roseomonas marmotae TaxID=2768161 RepID=UPI001F0131B4|nr:Hsp33 family molecular chaperone HslO [Roseomonas marmotae]